jgi:hypothetical protein
MQVMLKKYYAKLHTNQRHSLMSMDDFLTYTQRKKRTKSQANHNNLTKSSEKSLKTRIKLVKKVPTSDLTRAKSKSNPKFRISHKSKPSLMPKSFIQKGKTSNLKPRKTCKVKTVTESTINLSDSYDSLLQQFNCDEDLKSSLKQLVRLEKLSLKKKFSGKNSLLNNNLLVNSYHNQKSKLL